MGANLSRVIQGFTKRNSISFTARVRSEVDQGVTTQ